MSVCDFYRSLPASLREDSLELLLSRGVSEAQVALYGVKDVPLSFPRPSEVPGGPLVCFPLSTVADKEVTGVVLRSIETKLYHVWSEAVHVEPFGMYMAREGMWSDRHVCLVEGVFDLFPLQRVFSIPVIATLTAGLSPRLARTLSRWVDTIYLSWDNDTTGRGATSRAMLGKAKAPEPFTFKDLAVPLSSGVKDIGDLWEKGGDDLVRETFIKAYPDLCRYLAPCR